MKRLLLSIMTVVGIMGMVSLAAPPIPAYAAKCTGGRLLTFPAWYKGLNCDSNGTIEAPSGEKGIQKFVTQIILNIIDILTQIAGYACIVFIIIGGYRYLTSGGNSNSMAEAGKTILNAIIGLLIAIFAVVIINLIGAAL